MNPVLEAVLVNNKADVLAIVQKIGLEVMIELAPHFAAIITTAQAASVPKTA
jgi:hypothetical protein